VKSTIAAPLVPTFIWSSRIVIKKELIEDDRDSCSSQTLAKRTDALLLLIIRLPVAEEYFRHEELDFVLFVPFVA